MYFVADPTSERTIAECWRHGWGCLTGPHRQLPTLPIFAVDNGAWKCRQGPTPEARLSIWTSDHETGFRRMTDTFGDRAVFVVAPDIVCGGDLSIRTSLAWLPWLLERTERVLLAVQDGMTAADIGPHLSARVGVAVGGSTGWKLGTVQTWARLARERGAWCHMLRVNTARRIALARAAGCDSADGSSVALFADSAVHVARALGEPMQAHLHLASAAVGAP